jgi:hypothetical protein
LQKLLLVALHYSASELVNLALKLLLNRAHHSSQQLPCC